MNGPRADVGVAEGASQRLLSRDQVGKLAGVLYLGSAISVLLALPLPQPSGTNRTALLAVASSALVVGALTLLVPWERLGSRASLAVVPPAFALIGVADALGGGFTSAIYGIFFVVVFVWIGIAHGPRLSLLFAPLAAVAYTVPIVTAGVDVASGVASAAVVIPVCAFVGEALGWVERRFAIGRRELAQSQERYETLVELSPDAIFVHVDGRVVFANSASLRLFGASVPGRLLRKPIDELVHPDWRDTVAERVAAELALGIAAPPLEVRFLRLDGSFIDVEVTGSPIVFEGRPAGQVVARDITERKRIDRSLRQSLESLRRLDADRRRLLDHLVTAQEEERSRLAREIHDDTVQVMSAAAMRLDLLERKPLSDDARHLVVGSAETVRRALERLRHLVFELRPELLRLAGLAGAIESYARSLDEEGRLEVRVTSGVRWEPPGAVREVAYRIAQEALNNVHRHAAASVVRIDVRTDQRGLLVRIADDGAGFDADADATDRSNPGHLGLTGMRERAQLAGGWLNVASSPGEGCEVELWLPTNPNAALDAVEGSGPAVRGPSRESGEQDGGLVRVQHHR